VSLMDPGSHFPYFSTAALVGLFVLAAFSWYFALSETAFASTSKIKLKARLERGDKRAEKALSVLDQSEKVISTVLIGTNICHISMGSIVSYEVTRLWGVSFVSLSAIIFAIIVFFSVEMLPKSMAKRRSESLSLAMASSMLFFMRIFGPLVYIMSKFGSALASLFQRQKEPSVTENEIYDIIEDLTDEGALDSAHGELMSSALQFEDVRAGSIVTARVDIAALDVEWPSEKIFEFIKEHKHSRLPVYEGNIDNIIGVLQIRKYLKCYFSEGEADLRDCLDRAHFFPASVKISHLLKKMSSEKINLAIIIDKYGGTMGLVTIEDILEELVGEIWDEDDVVEESFMPLGGGRYEVDAELNLEDLFEHLNYEPEEIEESLLEHSVGDWVYGKFGRIPKEREFFEFEKLRVTVDSMRQNRILKLVVEPKSEEDWE